LVPPRENWEKLKTRIDHILKSDSLIVYRTKWDQFTCYVLNNGVE
jgi:hypothetical protein